MPKIYVNSPVVNETEQIRISAQHKPLPRGNLSSMARPRAKEAKKQPISQKETRDSDVDEVNGGRYFCGVNPLSGQLVKIPCPNSQCTERVCMKDRFECAFPNEEI